MSKLSVASAHKRLFSVVKMTLGYVRVLFFPARPNLGRPSMAEGSVSEMKGHGIFPLTAVLTCSTDLLIMVVKLDFLRD